MRNSMLRVAAALGAAAVVSVAHADVVTDWNNQLLDCIRAIGGPPCPISRNSALTHVAIYDAVNSIDRTHQPFYAFIPTPGASRTAAAAQAARDVLVNRYPQRQAILDAALATSLASVPPGAARDQGVALGSAVAAAVLARRASDGTQSDPVYVLGGQPGDWRPTFPDFTSPPFNPGWGASTPWSMIDPDQFRPRGPLGFRSMERLLRSPGYARNVNEVKAFGSLTSTVRTPEQTQIAFFWANDVNGTSKPPGQLFQITQVVSADKGLTVSENARLFAMVAVAMGDAGVAAWDAKYDTAIDLWRPISAIREADTDNNPATVKDPAWEPLNPFTPPFPAYVSGHATFGAAHAAVMREFFATDRVTFTVGTDDPFYAQLGAPATRTFTSFSAAAWENAISRIYLGVHYRFDAEDGNRAGTAVGRHVYQNNFRARRRADFNNDTQVNSQDLTAFFSAYQAGSWRADFNRDGRLSVVDLVAYLACFRADCR